MKLTVAELRLIWHALSRLDEEGVYWGRRDHFRTRLGSAMCKIGLEIEKRVRREAGRGNG